MSPPLVPSSILQRELSLYQVQLSWIKPFIRPTHSCRLQQSPSVEEGEEDEVEAKIEEEEETVKVGEAVKVVRLARLVKRQESPRTLEKSIPVIRLQDMQIHPHFSPALVTGFLANQLIL